jgi:phosphoglycolate phosphatase-like HAD superfamily hydrolase
MSTKQVTIIVPNYKTYELTKVCLRLLRKNTDLNHADVIVVDNNSNDESTKYLKNQHWMVMSGGDQEEVRTILAAKHLDHLFDYGIYGSPDSKHEIVKYHLENNDNFMPAIFFGDAEYDIKTAKNFNLDFVFISGWSDFSAWEETVKAENIISVKHLKDLII